MTQFTYIGRDGDFSAYQAVLRPWLWHATRRSDFKIFQFRKAPDIIKEVLGKYGFSIEDRLTGNYREWTYMVQYGETDFNFVSRLMEEEGIFYFFYHSSGSHKLVLADDIGSVSALPNGPTTIPVSYTHLDVYKRQQVNDFPRIFPTNIAYCLKQTIRPHHHSRPTAIRSVVYGTMNILRIITRIP